ncbi:putative clathrin assembly protein At1g03050 [Nicotiana sylvestris]|uniref:Clathrin assembly protein At1g03050 n=1 Tax=Nicotiana sylvestris TaxID=4096 RepID=A0A1U7XE98_NICSY|nr:PREDICTED: putative clathrin assembly protein At1g03050 [Nicotiana sylvestris]XP_009787976.1 PREDICTED: putative clathrin assembly protein At1g03050 [Nicotiana sylvestris]
MAPSTLRKAIGAVKDQTSISLAKVGSSASLSDLEVAIVKVTRHEEYPPEERHIREILSLTSYSRAYVGACVSFISRRLGKTKNWVVALKALMLIHRLLSDGDPSYEDEIFFATRRGTRLLNMSDFRDSRSNSWDCSAFVRSYALYLDEHLEFKMQNRRGKRSAFSYNDDEEEARHNAKGVKATPLREMKNDRVFSRIHHLMQLLERFLACRPAGLAKNNRVVIVALYPLVKESFQLYYDLTEIITILFDKFIELSIPDSVKVLEIFFRINKQYEELEQFYDWGKTVGLARTSEYPDIEIIPPKKLERMDDLIREKSFREQNRKAAIRNETTTEHVQETEKQETKTEPEEDINAVKALPAPEVLPKETEEKKEEDDKKDVVTQEVGDLLNLSEDVPTTEEHGDQLALALFDGGQATTNPTTSISPWHAFNDSGDWETALVQSASQLSNQKASFPGGFDTSTLDGMYQQGAVAQAVASSGVVATGSASSVAFGSAGRPAMLALPAPPTANGGASTAAPGTDPFAASLAIAPPAYVQMSEMEKKQRLLVEEQLMWQEYQRNGMQGQVALAKAQPNPYPHNIGGYRQTF